MADDAPLWVLGNIVQTLRGIHEAVRLLSLYAGDRESGVEEGLKQATRLYERLEDTIMVWKYEDAPGSFSILAENWPAVHPEIRESYVVFIPIKAFPDGVELACRILGTRSLHYHNVAEGVVYFPAPKPVFTGSAGG